MDVRKPEVGVIGAGSWGQNHVRVWRELGHLAAVCDASPERLEKVSTESGVPATPNLEGVLADGNIAAVVVATPAITHAAIARRALEAGKHVLVEKPLALDVSDAEDLVELADLNGLILAVGHVLEYHPAVRRLKELADGGELGRVHYLYANRLNLGRIRTEENALWSFAPHDIAMMNRILEVEPETVACHGGSYLGQSIADVTLTTLTYPAGVKAHVYVSWLHPFKEHRFVVMGEKQMAVFDDTAPWDSKLRLYPHTVDWIKGQLPVARKADATLIPLEEAEPLRLEALAFVDAIKDGKPPLADGHSGLAVLKILRTAQESLENGGQPRHMTATNDRYFVHPSAEVARDALVGIGTRIWHSSHVMSGASIGRNCTLGQNVFVGRNVRIGDGVKIQNNVSVYEGVELEDGVFCGPSMVFTNVLDPRSEIERKSEFQKTLVGRGATLGANCTIVCGNAIGRYAFVAAGAVVTRDVAENELVMGVPAKRAGWVCECGRRLAFSAGEATCGDCGRSYLTTGDSITKVSR